MPTSLDEVQRRAGESTGFSRRRHQFTIYDFVKAYEHFSDPDWDGEPQAPEPTATAHSLDDAPPLKRSDSSASDAHAQPLHKLRIKLADGKERTIQHMSATSFWSPDGQPISAAQFIQRLFGDLPELFKDEDELRRLWRCPQTRNQLLAGLEEKGYSRQQLGNVGKLIAAEHSDLYDVLAYIAFNMAPVSRAERVNAHKARIFHGYDYRQQEFLRFILDHYVAQGVSELDITKLPQLIALKYHSLGDAVQELGPANQIREVFVDFQQHLY